MRFLVLILALVACGSAAAQFTLQAEPVALTDRTWGSLIGVVDNHAECIMGVQRDVRQLRASLDSLRASYTSTAGIPAMSCSWSPDTCLVEIRGFDGKVMARYQLETIKAPSAPAPSLIYIYGGEYNRKPRWTYPGAYLVPNSSLQGVQLTTGSAATATTTGRDELYLEVAP